MDKEDNVSWATTDDGEEELFGEWKLSNEEARIIEAGDDDDTVEKEGEVPCKVPVEVAATTDQGDAFAVSTTREIECKTMQTESEHPVDREVEEDKSETPKQHPRRRLRSPGSPSPTSRRRQPITEHPAKVVPKTGFNVVLTHCTADFDSLASAVGLAKLWSAEKNGGGTAVATDDPDETFDSASDVPTFVVLPRGAHPGVQRFLALHKHLFPIRSLKSLPSDLSALNRLALVDAQRRDRLGPAENLLRHAKRITVVDHHIDQSSDIAATDYVIDQVGSVSTLMVERLQQCADEIELSEAEATLLALGIHADTGSLCFDSTTARDAYALAWCMEQGASQAAIAEHAQSSLSQEQQGVLTQALLHANTTLVHGVTVSTALLSADGFINGLASVTQDAMELSSSDVFLLGLVYEAKSGGRGRKSRSKNSSERNQVLTSKLLPKENLTNHNFTSTPNDMEAASVIFAEAWKGGEEALRKRRLRAAFDRTDTDGSGHLDKSEVEASLASSGVIIGSTVDDLMEKMDGNGDGKVDFEEFVLFATEAEKRQQEENQKAGRKALTMIIIGRVKAGINLKDVKLNRLLERFGGGGHAKAASATLKLNEESEAEGVLQDLVDELIETSLKGQPTVGDFMTAPVLSVQPDMTVQQVEDLFTRYDVRALPVVDENHDVIGLVSYQLVAAAKQRLWNKEQKRLRRERAAQEEGIELPHDERIQAERKKGTTVKGWMLQHVRTVEASKTMAEVESILLENDVGCIPVVADGTKKLVGMVTRTDLLRQHRYYPSLPYHNKGFANSIAARKPIIELRKRLKQFDLD
jgi:nanoRNase/pAp phosphatase (c-di-AMP/oligoRNAs hydrolase)